jgi:hypothetical protein
MRAESLQGHSSLPIAYWRYSEKAVENGEKAEREDYGMWRRSIH